MTASVPRMRTHPDRGRSCSQTPSTEQAPPTAKTDSVSASPRPPKDYMRCSTYASVVVAPVQLGDPRAAVLPERELADGGGVRDVEVRRALRQHKVVEVLDRVLFGTAHSKVSCWLATTGMTCMTSYARRRSRRCPILPRSSMRCAGGSPRSGRLPDGDA